MLVGAIFLFTDREYGWGFTLIFLSIIPFLLFFRNENIIMAFWHMRKQDLDKSKVWLLKITNYKSQLIRKQWGYYHYLMGISEAQANVSASEKYMKKALEYGLSFKHDRAMAKLSLAGTAMAKGRRQEAEILLKEARTLDTQGMFTDQIKMMQNQMKRINIGKNLQNPHMRNRGKF